MRALFVDGHYYLYRSFFAIRGLTNSRGEPTNAIFGFVKALRRMLADVKPDLGAVVWDAGIPARRAELQPDYKQNRPAMPDAMRPQEAWLQERIACFGPASVWVDQTEADDLIASYAVAAAARGIEVVIATNDKDILQMAGERVKIYSTAKADAADGAFALLGTDEVRAKWGVEPAQIADVLALTGDTSDNIPGVPGIGGKTAAQLVTRFGSVEAMIARVNEIDNVRIRDKVMGAVDQIRANRAMVTLDTDLSLPVPVDQLGLRPDPAAMLAAVRECEFKTLTREIEAEDGATGQGTLGI